MKTSRFTPLFLAAVLVPLVASALSPLYVPFTDVPANAWYTAYVMDAVNDGIVSGYKDRYGNSTGKFGPENPVTFAEALKIALASANYSEDMGIGSGHWAARYLSIALGLNFESTRSYPNLNLDRPATRAEVASMMADAFKVPHNTFVGDDYSDVDAGTAYAGAIDALTNDSVISGDTDANGNVIGRFRPYAAINRAEVVKIAIGMRDHYGIPQNPTYPSSAQYYYSSSYGACSLYQCGTAPAMPNWQCNDGSLGGPSCERLPDGRCGWLIRQCLSSSSTSSTSSRSSSFSSHSSSRSSSHSSSRSSSRSSSVSNSRSSSRSSSLSSSFQAEAFDVRYTDTGYQPSFLSVRKGDVVTFTNDSNFGMWVASNPHPDHSDYPELNMHTSVGKDSKFIFTFDKIGTWGYHNHLNQNHQAVIVVDPR